MACWWNAFEPSGDNNTTESDNNTTEPDNNTTEPDNNTTEPDFCPNHCYEHKKCYYDAIPEWCHT